MRNMNQMNAITIVAIVSDFPDDGFNYALRDENYSCFIGDGSCDSGANTTERNNDKFDCAADPGNFIDFGALLFIIFSLVQSLHQQHFALHDFSSSLCFVVRVLVLDL